MSGLEGLALGAAPLAGGVLLGGMASKGSVPDLRAVIKSDLDLLRNGWKGARATTRWRAGSAMTVCMAGRGWIGWRAGRATTP